ncbi:MAG: hypothetical protein ACE14U_03790 [Candidatus Velamenicoccus archaeovorus]
MGVPVEPQQAALKSLVGNDAASIAPLPRRGGAPGQVHEHIPF